MNDGVCLKMSKNLSTMIESGTDNKGLTRKKREYIGFIAALLAGVIIYSIPTESFVLSIVLILVQVFCVYEAIKAISSHDITTWKHSRHVKLCIFIGCLFGGIGGAIVYYYLKHKEEKY